MALKDIPLASQTPEPADPAALALQEVTEAAEKAAAERARWAARRQDTRKHENFVLKERRKEALELAITRLRPGAGTLHRDRELFAEAQLIFAYLWPADRTVDDFRNSDSNLITHALYELELLGEEPETIVGYLRMIEIFSEMGHSGGSASVFTPTLNALMRFRNLKDLTDDPNEWNHVGDNADGTPVYQSRRRADAFSNDGGATYYCLDEGDSPRIMHDSARK